MSRADDYGDFYRESWTRLLAQVYAYAGDAEVAQRALTTAYVSAADGWRGLGDVSDRDAWVRVRAFGATAGAGRRSTTPWYARALRTADENRPLLRALDSLAPADRHLVISHHLAGLDLPAAAREVGLGEPAAAASLRASATTLARAGVDSSPAGLRAGLIRLGGDVRDVPPDDAERLRRRGSRRHSARWVVPVVAALGVVAAAGWVIESGSDPEPPPLASSASTTATAPTPPAEDPFSAGDLTTATQLRQVDRREHWVAGATTRGLASGQRLDSCLASPSAADAEHYWTREFTAGRGETPRRATETLQVASSPGEARRAYRRWVRTYAACSAGARQVADFRRIDRLGDDASLTILRFVDAGLVRQRQVAVAASGSAVAMWVVRDSPGHPVRPRAVMRMLGQSVDSVCGDSHGRCARPPYAVTEALAPTTDPAAGFLASVDLPVFAAVDEPWVATEPEGVQDNPAATACDRADFDDATKVRARSFVIPGAPGLSTVFGMSETVGAFASPAETADFVAGVTRAVGACPQRQLSLNVTSTDELHVGAVDATVWEIEAAASPDTSFVFRTAVLRTGSTAAQLTFTPTAALDVTRAGYLELVTRAAQRLTAG